MNFVDATILGIVEGLTEFLPVSSTGHLILTGHMLGATGEAESTFEVFIQLGAILAVVFLYSQRFKMLFDWNREDGAFAGKRGWLILGLTTLPPAIGGLLLHDFIKEHLFTNITPVLWALGIGGAVIIIIEQIKLKPSTEQLDGISYKQALMIGCFQTLSLWPGVSRAAATIIGGLFSGLNRQTATEYSFIAAVPLMCLATSYDLLKSLDTLQVQDIAYFATGFVVAFFSAILAVKSFIKLVQRWSLTPFGVYRILLVLVFFWVMGLQ